MELDQYRPILDRYVAFLRANCDVFTDPFALGMATIQLGQLDSGFRLWAQKFQSGELFRASDEDFISIEEPSVRLRRYKCVLSEMLVNLEVLLQVSSGQLGKVIDVGGGPGIVGAFLLLEKLAESAINIDPSAEALKLAEELAKKVGVPLETRAGWLQDIPAEDESCDTCVVMDTLESSTQWEDGLPELVRIVKPGGLLYITILGQQFRTRIDPNRVLEILAGCGMVATATALKTALFPKFFIIGRK